MWCGNAGNKQSSETNREMGLLLTSYVFVVFIICYEKIPFRPIE